ncbi:MAG: aminotransferase class V-fold PLP-dependent enzyme, partial [Planctomycetaceae bacterium]
MTSSYVADELRLSRRASLLALGGMAGSLGVAGPAALAAAADSAPTDWEQVSRQFLIDRNLTYLNTGSLGSTPIPVLEARRAIERRLESNPAGEGFGSVMQTAEAVSGKVADLIGCNAKEVTITRNTTEGMNFVIEGLKLQPGQRVLTSNSEHPGGLAACKYFQKHHGLEIDVAEIGAPPASEEEVVESFRKALQPNTRAIVCSHVTFCSGVKVPIARLSELAHQHGCLLIADGAQAAGGVPVNVKELGCDAYVSSGHKFLLGPKGTGLLYISEGAKEQIKPMQLEDGYGYYTAIRGTNSMPEAIGLGSAIDWVQQLGRSAVFARLKKLRDALYAVLQETPGIQPSSPSPDSSMASQLVCFRVEDRDKYAR